MLPTLIAALLLFSTLLGSTAAASYPKTRVRVCDEKPQHFDVERSGPTAKDASGKLALTDGNRGGRNLCYNRFRYFDPASGRYISPDPVGLAGGLNVFAFAASTTGWVDPYGLTERCPPLTRRQALQLAKRRAGIPLSQQPTRQWQVGSRRQDQKNYKYSSDTSKHGRYYEFDTPTGKVVIVEHTKDRRGPHFHAGQPKPLADPRTYDFKEERYQQIGGHHHIDYS